MPARMPTFDCIQEYEQARLDRFWDGVSLWSTGRETGAVYMLGYTAEIAVKCAYFRVSGFTILQPIRRAELNTAEARAKTLGVTAKPDGFHNICFWRDLLIAHRRTNGRPLDTVSEKGLMDNTKAVSDRWSIEMRYKRGYLSTSDVEQVARAVDWIDKNYVVLYS